MKKILFLTLILTIAACGQNGKKAEEKVPVKVGVATIASTETINYKVFVGEIDASSTYIISAGHIGVLDSICVKQGSTVKGGEIVANITSKNVQATYEMSQATLRQAEDGYERVKKVHQSGTIPDVKLIEIETQLAKARAAAKTSEQSLEECMVKAPFDGTISDIQAEKGIQVNPGTPLMTIVDINTIIVTIPVPEGEIGSMKIGQKAFIDVPALGLNSIEAKVKEKGVTAKFPSHTYECTIAPDKKVKELLPGMVCKVRIPDESSLNHIIIPASTVEMDEDGRFVWTVKNGKVGKTYITVGGYQNKGIEVTSGLEYGDVIIVQGAAKVSTGMSVTTVEQTI